MIKADIRQTEAAAADSLAEESRERKAVARLRSARRALRRRARFYVGLCIVCLFYGMTIFAETLAPYDYRAQSRREPLAPPTTIRFRDARGHWHARPFIYARRLVDPLARRYEEQTESAYTIELFTRGYPYRLFGVLPTDLHLFGVRGGAQTGAPRVNLLGTDALGRDRWSRLLIASRFSLLVGPSGTLAAAALGVLLGCISGYARRSAGAMLMRAADVMMALPVLVLILAARAAFPVELPPARAALLLILIFLGVGWAEMARVTRGLVTALRRREFVLAAESIGLSQGRILFRHILPNAMRPIIVQVTLMLPAFLLAETALSFLGVGLQEPEASWGSMLASAADPALLAEHTFVLLSPALAIFIFVLGVRLLSDGLKPKNAG